MLGQMPWVDRCLSARTGAEALAVCRRYEPHVALVDLFLGGESGPEICERLRAEAPAPRVLLMSGAGGISPRAARAAGAAGFISKDWPAPEIAKLVRMVGDGQEVFRDAATPGADADRPRGRDPRPDRRRRHQPRDRGGAVPLAAHRQGAHEHALSQARGAQPRRRGAARAAPGPASLSAGCFDEQVRAAPLQAHGPDPPCGRFGARRAVRGGGERRMLPDVSTGAIAGLFPGQGSQTSALRDERRARRPGAVGRVHRARRRGPVRARGREHPVRPAGDLLREHRRLEAAPGARASGRARRALARRAERAGRRGGARAGLRAAPGGPPRRADGTRVRRARGGHARGPRGVRGAGRRTSPQSTTSCWPTRTRPVRWCSPVRPTCCAAASRDAREQRRARDSARRRRRLSLARHVRRGRAVSRRARDRSSSLRPRCP